MALVAAYLTVILIWSTTPMAIQWSGDGVGPMFGLCARMLISLILCLLIMRLFRIEFPREKRAMATYVGGGLGLYAAMTLVYFSSQWIPSGWISVIFGLTPIMTAIIAMLIIREKFTVMMAAGALLGVFGLGIIFTHGDDNGTARSLGVLLVLLAAMVHALSAVTVKKFGAALHPLASTSGGLLVAVPLYLLTWWFSDGSLPDTIPLKSAVGFIYLGVVGSVLGFSLYFYLLKRCSASQVALVTLVTPICALMLGQWFNHEPLTQHVIWGGLFVISGLICYQ